MQKSKSSFRFLNLLLLGCLASCARAPTMREVPKDAYAKDNSCWINGGKMKAFAVFAVNRSVAVPYIISSKCVVLEGYNNISESTIDLVNAPGLDKSASKFDKLINMSTISNTRTDLPAPESSAGVYYFVGHVVTNATGIYTIQSIEKLTPTGLRFGEFLKMSSQDREAFCERVCS